MAVAKKVGATGTPAFRINGVSLSGAQPFDKFKEVIDKQLAEAKKLVASGTKPTEVYVAMTNENQQAQPASRRSRRTTEAPEEDDKTVWRCRSATLRSAARRTRSSRSSSSPTSSARSASASRTR